MANIEDGYDEEADDVENADGTEDTGELDALQCGRHIFTAQNSNVQGIRASP